ncbi:hypothetical protein AB0J83_49930, partial [Actinoplanes sp. NPDC049596]
TTPARTAWSDAEAVSRAQAANWQAVAAAAAAASGPNWDPILAPATANETEWAAEATSAEEQGRFWAELYREALAGEQRMSAPAIEGR